MLQRTDIEKILNTTTIATDKQIAQAYSSYFRKQFSNPTGERMLPTTTELLQFPEANEFNLKAQQAMMQILIQAVGEKKLNNHLEKHPIKDISEYLLKNFLLKTGFCIGTNDKDEVGLYTTNIELLQELYNKGAIVVTGKTPFEKSIATLEKKLAGGLTKKGAEYSLGMARLDVENIKGDENNQELAYKMVLTNFMPYNSPDFRLYPYTIYKPLSDSIIKLMSNNIYRVYQDKAAGLKERIATASESVEKLVYSNEPPEVVKDLIENIRIGWDLSTLTVRLYNLEASIYTVGYTKLDLHDLVGLQQIKESEINKEKHRINLEELEVQIEEKLQELPKEELLHLLDLDEFKRAGVDLEALSEEEIREHIIKYLRTNEALDLVDFAKNNKKVLGDLITKTKNKQEKLHSRFGKREEITLENLSNEQAQAELNRLLNDSVLRIKRYTSKNTGITTILATNNKQILSDYYGVDYIKNYGTDSERLKDLKLRFDGNLDPDNVAKYIKEYRLEKYFETPESFKEFVQSPDLPYYGTSKNQIVYTPEDKEPNYDLIYFREIKPVVKGDTLLRSANIDRIQKIERIEYK